MKEECKLEDMFVREASPFFSKANGGEATIAADADPKAPRVRVQITHVLGVGGGAWSGPKSMSIEASLVENGKVTRSTKLTRSTTGGAFGGVQGHLHDPRAQREGAGQGRGGLGGQPEGVGLRIRCGGTEGRMSHQRLSGMPV